METNSNEAVSVLGVVGTGTMGRGIAQIAAQAGIEVLLHDAKPGAAQAARESVAKTLEALVAKGRLETAAAAATRARLQTVDSLDALARCDVVVEAIVEDLQAKQTLFQALERLVPVRTLLATNTSSLSVTAVAAACSHPERVVGWHFFNPVPLMRIAEVIEGERTAQWVAQRLAQLTARLGHTAVRAQDMPGFVVNHAGRAYIPEGLRLLSEGVADFHVIDSVMRDCAGFRMGPFELIDLIGLDVGQMVMESLYRQYHEEPRFKVTPLVARRVAAGLLGRKTGAGFYQYVDGQPRRPVEEPLPAARPVPIWICPDEPDLARTVREVLAGAGCTIESGSVPSAQALIVTTPIGKDTTTTCFELGLDATRTVAVDALFSLRKRRPLMFAPVIEPRYRDAACAAFGADGTAVSVLRDSPGFVAQRIVAQIISIGCDIAQQRIAAPADIDLAVTLALGYPSGPFGLGDSLGLQRVLRIAQALCEAYQEPRYRPSIWLKRRAQLGVSLLHVD